MILLYLSSSDERLRSLLPTVSLGLQLRNSLSTPDQGVASRGVHPRQHMAHLPDMPHRALAAVPQFPSSLQDHKALAGTWAFEGKKLQKQHAQRLAPLSLN